MAVITIDHDQLNSLLGTEVSAERLEQEGSMLGVLFEPNDDGTIDVEVEPNRPDLLSVEGLARALRGFFGIDPGLEDIPVQDGDLAVTRDGPVKQVRPHIACARVTGIALDQDALDSLIQLQEKLTETYGRQREKIAIGLHDLDAVQPPIHYRAADPDETFQPLGRDEAMTLDAILDDHEKGTEYGWIIADHDRYPLLEDDDGTVLAMPPVINGTATEVTTATTDLFIDITGTAQDEVETALAIVVAALHERGGRIESIDVDGRRQPRMVADTMSLDAQYVRDIAGLDLSTDGIIDQLRHMNYDAHRDDGTVTVDIPAYRADIMHEYDLIEDVVIAYGYDDVEPVLPDIATVGGRTRTGTVVDHLRDVMVGAGAQECMTFILTDRDDLLRKMGRGPDTAIVSMDNPLTEEYAVVRDRVLPSLVEVLADNTHNRYPQTLFEVGRCSVLDDDTPTGARDVRRLAYVHADRDATFTDARSVLQAVATALDLDLSVTAEGHAAFDDQRSGTVSLDDTDCGRIGMLSDDVRGAWGLDDVEVAAFALDVDTVTILLDA